MTLENALLWWWLDILTTKRYNALIQVFGSLDTALAEISATMLSELGLKHDAVERTLARIRDFQPDDYKAAMDKNGVTLLTIEDEHYPMRLKQIADAPLFLSYKGNLRLLDRALIGVVGTREMTAYGKRVVHAFVPTLIRAHLTTVSGLALGIDAEVAISSMRAGGQTIAVLGSGLATIYPRTNAQVAEDILKHDGLLLSEFPLHTPPDKYTFPSRNRIIAGLSEATLVCEAPESSGSIITAELALDYNREVFAVPGPIFETNAAGCHNLIKSGQAHMVTIPEDILRHLGVLAPDETFVAAYKPQSPREISVYAVLTGMPQTVDDIIEKTGCSVADVTIALTMLQMADAARVLEGGMWVRH
jgi:DNA processing protein